MNLIMPERYWSISLNKLMSSLDLNITGRTRRILTLYDEITEL